LEIENGISRTIAVDGFRMALAEEKVEGAFNLNFLLSLRAIKELARALSSINSEKIKLRFENRQIAFDLGSTVLVCKVVDAEFPNYRRVIPEDFKTRAVVDRNILKSAVRRVSIMTRAGSETIKIGVENEKIKFSSRSADLGEAEELVDAQIEGEPLTIAFNPNFILDALNHIEEEKVQLNFVDSNKPLMIDTPDLKGYFFIVMPVRI
jgi:DNA polymerase-3 subunit beta